ncbi:MAG: flagellar protein FlgN [Verrucomicrobiota bacterium]|jgi:flagellar biosynthesis/type III secretory pathway chaperone|nr:flagellar protein FlgN [Verrucomicrobiota bacterium]
MNNDDLNRLIESLRTEMTQYGELLALMQEQQELIINRQPQELLANINEVVGQNGQMEKIAMAREAREQARLTLATQLGGTGEMTFKQMTGQLPEEYRPLLEALVDEINALLQKVQKWLRQNHLLLKRSLDLMQDILQNIFPTQASPKTYGRQGAVSPVNPPPSTLYEGII